MFGTGQILIQRQQQQEFCKVVSQPGVTTKRRRFFENGAEMSVGRNRAEVVALFHHPMVQIIIDRSVDDGSETITELFVLAASYGTSCLLGGCSEFFYISMFGIFHCRTRGVTVMEDFGRQDHHTKAATRSSELFTD